MMENINSDNEKNKEEEINEISFNFEGEMQINNENKIKAIFNISKNCLMFNQIEGDIEIFMPYRDIIFFAVNNENRFLIMEYNSYSSEAEAESSLIKFYSDCPQDQYDKIQSYNILHENEEFREEPEGENELFTAENLK